MNTLSVSALLFDLLLPLEHFLADEPHHDKYKLVQNIWFCGCYYLCNLVGQGFSTMNLAFLGNIPWFKAQSNTDFGTTLISTEPFTEPPKQNSDNDPKLSGWPLSLLSLIPWANNVGEKFQRPSTINKELKRYARRRGDVVGKENRAPALRFKPYVCKVPWHTGVRAVVSQLFPRYGNYCGPNWSSGKDNGSLVWDRRPIDWLDFCCYCHDIGYDTHDQAKLLKADLAFLECLEKQHMSTKGNPHIALLYKTMCINGLKNFLIPYRTHLVNLQQQFGQPLIQFGWLSNLRWRSWNFQKNEG
ncbi:hypothetical protein RIF29_42239 [Crotalaria pallida]|uniref:Phospholipase A2 n=1 Tax=Crotalaria pallida TaxID=3830 RepID=A0AAN9E9G4_CROPI